MYITIVFIISYFLLQSFLEKESVKCLCIRLLTADAFVLKLWLELLWIIVYVAIEYLEISQPNLNLSFVTFQLVIIFFLGKLCNKFRNFKKQYWFTTASIKDTKIILYVTAPVNNLVCKIITILNDLIIFKFVISKNLR